MRKKGEGRWYLVCAPVHDGIEEHAKYDARPWQLGVLSRTKQMPGILVRDATMPELLHRPLPIATCSECIGCIGCGGCIGCIGWSTKREHVSQCCVRHRGLVTLHQARVATNFNESYVQDSECTSFHSFRSYKFLFFIAG